MVGRKLDADGCKPRITGNGNFLSAEIAQNAEKEGLQILYGQPIWQGLRSSDDAFNSVQHDAFFLLVGVGQMKMLFTSQDRAHVGLLKNMLDEANIQCQIRNDCMSANFPGTAFSPQRWIVNDDDLPKAAESRETLRADPTQERSSWTCPGCGEKLEGQFLSCWNCGTTQNDAG